jgi:hypothetical protein
VSKETYILSAYSPQHKWLLDCADGSTIPRYGRGERARKQERARARERESERERERVVSKKEQKRKERTGKSEVTADAVGQTGEDPRTADICACECVC